MKSIRFMAATALATISVFAVSGTAFAQAAPADEAAEEDSGPIIVTGSRIARPNVESTVPLTVVSGEEIFATGNTSVGDLLNDMPALRNTYSQQNSSRTLGTAGLNLVDLHSLGTQRTLVLVNGRRHIGADILNNAVSADINTIPTALVDRVEIITGGSSAVYGSDAISGVVNFVLKKNFEGVELRGQAGTSKYGDAGNYFLSGTAGMNFAEDRGNIVLNAEYSHQTPFFQSQRPSLSKVNGFLTVDTDPSGADATIDRVFAQDIRSTTISPYGLFQVSPAAGFAPCGRDSLGAAYRCVLQFQQDGSLVAGTGQRAGLAPNGSYIGGNGATGREGPLVGVYPTMDRYSINLLAHFDVSDAFKPFVEAKYVRTETTRWGSPAFFQGSTIDGAFERPRYDNPFLTDQARATLNATRQAAGLPAISNPATRIPLFKNLTDLGSRREDATRETFRVVAGIGGTFNDDWKYEASVNYATFRESTKVLGNLDQQRFTLAMDSARDSTGKIVCRSQLPGQTGATFPFADNQVLAAARLANDVATCVPFNPFGGAVTDEMRSYLLQNTTSVGKINQMVVSGYVSGDLSQLFELPGGPVGFAVGGEYRRETNYFKADDLVASGITFYNALPLFDPPSFSVKELYGELRAPVLKETPFFHELSLTAAGRVADYKGITGTVYAYNGGVEWAPIRDIRFRAGYGRSVRAPNLSDLYSAQSQNFTPAPSDPCSARNIGTGSATRTANCRAAGIPAAYDYVYTASLEILSGGNPGLREETSDSITLGAVIEPRFIPGLTMTVDYYNIKVNDVITAPSAQQILNACYDAASLNNQFCSLFSRVSAGSTGPRGEEQFRILEGSLQQTTLNYAKLKVRGIDAEIAYRRELGSWGNLKTRLTYTHLLQNDEFLDPVNPGYADQTLFELGDPQNLFNWDTEFKAGKFTLGFQLRYVGKQVLNNYEDFFSKQGRAPENADFAAVKFYPSTFYQDIRFGIDVNDTFNFYGGVDNLYDRKPPYGLTGLGAEANRGGGSGIYDVRGRYFYAGFKAKF